MPNLLETRSLVKHFPAPGGGEVHALDDVSLSIAAGETLGLVGESGSGKTTLGRCALLLEKPDAGEVLFEEKNLTALSRGDLRRMRRGMQMVFQDPYASLNPRMRVGRILAEPLEIHENLSGAQIRDQVRELLEAVGLTAEAAGRYPHEFSGGQRQRIGIARALALRPKFIVADEPVSALDVSVGAQIVNLLEDLQQRFGLTYLFISHGLPVVRHISTRVAVMYLGKLCEIAPTGDLFNRPLHPYTILLKKSTPDVNPQATGQTSALALAGGRPAPGAGDGLSNPQFSEPPSALHPPSGCRFRTRCPLAQARCAEEVPALRQLEPGHFVACHFAEQVPGAML